MPRTLTVTGYGGRQMEAVDLSSIEGRGPAWGTASQELNATLLIWDAGDGQPAHVNDERDVVLVVLDGSGTMSIDGDTLHATTGTLVVIPRGSNRSIVAGGEGMRCLTVHRRRGGLTIKQRQPPDAG